MATFERCDLWIYFLTLFLSCESIILRENDTFNEELFVKPFKSGHELFFFQFTTLWNSRKPYSHYRLFPRSLGDVLSTYNVQELHLTQAQGFWKHNKWGYPPEDAPPGVELWVWFKPGTLNIDKQWSDLVNALGGLFCSSLNFMDWKSTVSPHWSFRPQGVATKSYHMKSMYLRYSALPKEIVCTENLTPWRKLLPCDKVGLSSLFNTAKLYDSSYHSIGIHVRPICLEPKCSSASVELKQTLSVVFDTSSSKVGKQDWSFKKTLGQPLGSKCSMATLSKIYVDITSQQEIKLTLKPDADKIVKMVLAGDKRIYAVYDVTTQLPRNYHSFNLQGIYTEVTKHNVTTESPVHATRYVTGFGLQRGGITCQIYNNLPVNMTVIYMETIPWFIKIFFNSLQIQNNKTVVKPYKIHYMPGKDRSRSYHLEVVFRLRANSVTKINVLFERTFLKWTEYPPDANHGFYINSAVITTVLPKADNYISVQPNVSLFQSFEDKSSEFFIRIHTETLLVSLPTPDFSMPYNVICLACTVVAIAFGSLHNLTTRQFKVVESTEMKGLVQKVKDFFKIKEQLKDVANKIKTEDQDSEQTDNECCILNE